MNKKQLEILKAIFEKPAKSNIKWNDIESLLKHLGAQITQGNGSRIRIVLNEVKAVFHRPHPKKETDKGALTSVRKFLKNAGIDNDGI
ncbi:MAG: type II toxin-antitoxin system HicA family toxin [bacterium]